MARDEDRTSARDLGKPGRRPPATRPAPGKTPGAAEGDRATVEEALREKHGRKRK